MMMTMTAKEAIQEIAKLVPELDALKAAEAAAKDDAIKAKRIELLDSKNDSFAIVMGEPLNDRSTGRRAALCRLAAKGFGASDLRKYGDAVRIGTAEKVVLPSGRYGNLSRGKSWCRKGSGKDAVWADSHKHTVEEPGKWTVGSDDGFSRKEKTVWNVFVACGIFCAD